MDVKEEIKGFMSYLDGVQLSESSKRTYSILISAMLKEIDEIIEENVNKWIVMHPYRNTIAAVKHYLGYKDIEFELVRIRQQKRKPFKVPDREELRKTIDKLRDEELAFIYHMLWYTGARIVEVLKLRLGDINFQSNEITFYTKGNDWRIVPVPSHFLSQLYNYLTQEKGILKNELCFFTNTENRHAAYVLLQQKVLKENLTDDETGFLLKTHSFRRAIINYILEKTSGDIVAAQEFVGHSDIGITQRYLSDAYKKSAREKAIKVLELR